MTAGPFSSKSHGSSSRFFPKASRDSAGASATLANQVMSVATIRFAPNTALVVFNDRHLTVKSNVCTSLGVSIESILCVFSSRTWLHKHEMSSIRESSAYRLNICPSRAAVYEKGRNSSCILRKQACVAANLS